MPTYTAPTTRSTGALITASIYNTDLVENLKYFKDAPAFAGAVSVGGALSITGALSGVTTLATSSTINGQTISSTAVSLSVGGTSAILLDATSNYNIVSLVNSTSLTSNVGIFGGASGDATRLYFIAATGGGFLWRSGVTGDFMTLSSAGLLTLSGNSATFGIEGNDTNGLGIAATNASGDIRFYAGGSTQRWKITGASLVGGTASAGAGDVVVWAPGAGNSLSSLAGTGGDKHIRFFNNNGEVGSISTSGSATAYNVSSDQRLKIDRGVALSTDVLRRLIIHDFEWKTDGTLARGVFAQEAYLVHSSAVSVGSDAQNAQGQLVNPWSVDYSKYVPDLIVGWQNHESRLAALEAKLLKETAS